MDLKHKLIAGQEVCNRVLDMGLLAPTVEAAMETLGVDKIEAVADRGYFKIEDIEACDVGWRRYIPDMNGSHSFKEKQDDRFYPVCRSCNDPIGAKRKTEIVSVSTGRELNRENLNRLEKSYDTDFQLCKLAASSPTKAMVKQ
ncbi:hypothetical protein SZ54_4458 [Rhizobium sp. UR51a]|nr:hypothetical protein SZ54_4458 [Rhizobium sp. UR51a]